MSKSILFAVFLQLTAGSNGEPTVQVMAATSTEFESVQACQNAATGLMKLGDVTGFRVNVICAPKDIGKLEVEKPKQKAPAKDLGGGAERGSSS